jgi:hypothetical protein
MALEAFVQWRAWAMHQDRRARLCWRTDDGHFLVHWEEVDSKVGRGSGSGDQAPLSGSRHPGEDVVDELALPLLARVMTAHCGTLRWSAEPFFQVSLRWPLCIPVSPSETVLSNNRTVASRT